MKREVKEKKKKPKWFEQFEKIETEHGVYYRRKIKEKT